jgi:hypothetical protein
MELMAVFAVGDHHVTFGDFRSGDREAKIVCVTLATLVNVNFLLPLKCHNDNYYSL